MNADNKQLQIKCPFFGEDGQIPKKHTGFGENISPEFLIGGLAENVASMAIIMDDLDVPIIGCFNHWLIWNLPATSRIAENIPYGLRRCSGQSRASHTGNIDTQGRSSRRSSENRTGIASQFTAWIACWICLRIHRMKSC